MVDIIWERQMFTMLAIDVTAGGKEIGERSTAGSRTPGAFDPPPGDKSR